jgi:hypothetical protein
MKSWKIRCKIDEEKEKKKKKKKQIHVNLDRIKSQTPFRDKS